MDASSPNPSFFHRLSRIILELDRTGEKERRERIRDESQLFIREYGEKKAGKLREEEIRKARIPIDSTGILKFFCSQGSDILRGSIENGTVESLRDSYYLKTLPIQCIGPNRLPWFGRARPTDRTSVKRIEFVDLYLLLL